VTSYPTTSNHGMWWLTTRSWERLHAVSPNQLDQDDEGRLDDLRVGEMPLTALCGAAITSWPGVLSRLGMPRCEHCCRMLGIPPGHGTPGNEAARVRRKKGLVT